MPAKRLNQMVKDMSFEEKLLGVGSTLLALSIFLPWYQDIDSFKTGDMFLGITGPMYLSGFTLLVIAGVNLALLLSDGLDLKIPFSIKKNSNYFLASGIVAFYLLLLTSTVYFHPKFGFNITVKESQFGMFLAFIAAAFITFGGYLSTREKVARIKEFQQEAKEEIVAQDNLIKMPKPDIRKPKENLRNFQQSPRVPMKKPEQIPMDAVNQQQQFAAEQVQQEKPKVAADSFGSSHSGAQEKPHQKYRMDL
jgi:hypothetical protein